MERLLPPVPAEAVTARGRPPRLAAGVAAQSPQREAATVARPVHVGVPAALLLVLEVVEAVAQLPLQEQVVVAVEASKICRGGHFAGSWTSQLAKANNAGPKRTSPAAMNLPQLADIRIGIIGLGYVGLPLAIYL